MRQVKYTHEDEVPDMFMEAQTVEKLEDYEGELLFEDEDENDDVQFGVIDPRLRRPRADDVEPQLSVAELTQLDVLADEVEIRRLCKLSVLLEPATLDGVEHVVELSTRMVRTWREKEHAGQPVWYRRLRSVAREYAWLSQRSDLYSPASSAGCDKLIPIIMMQNPDFILFHSGHKRRVPHCQAGTTHSCVKHFSYRTSCCSCVRPCSSWAEKRGVGLVHFVQCVSGEFTEH